MLELSGVTKSYGGKRVLGPVDLAPPPGRTTVLIGPSGCGKSTVLRMMIGLAWPDTGQAKFEGVPIGPASAPALRRRMGYVIQEGGLFPHLDARGNAALMARYLRWTASRISTRLAELAELTRFPLAALDRYPTQLSGGQRQRVALMRALMLDPDVLLLDEPMGALDPLIRSDLQADLRSIFARLAKTVVLVTHDIAEAGFLGDRLVLMRDGSVVQEGTLRELVETPADEFVTRFISAQRTPLDSLSRSS